MLEVEKRVILTEAKFNELKKFFEQHAKVVKKFKRCTLINIEHADFTPDEDAHLDLRLRTTNDKCTLTVKYGDWRNDHGREEYEVDFDKKNFSEMLSILSLFGRKYFVLTYLQRVQFEFESFDITLDKYLNSNGHLLEVELQASNKTEAKAALQKISGLLERFQLRAVTPEDFVEFVQAMNDREEFQIDLTKNSPEYYLEKFDKFIKCEV